MITEKYAKDLQELQKISRELFYTFGKQLHLLGLDEERTGMLVKQYVEQELEKLKTNAFVSAQLQMASYLAALYIGAGEDNIELTQDEEDSMIYSAAKLADREVKDQKRKQE